MGKCDLIVGLQYGSEGKGKVAAMLAPMYDAAVRVGAPNAGHTIIWDGTTYKMRQIPCAWVNNKCKLFIGAGGLVSEEVFREELALLPEEVTDRIWIDSNAGVVLPLDREVEAHTGMNAFNGSTAEGIGPALARKIMRKQGTIVRDHPYFAQFAGNTRNIIRRMLDHGDRVMIEGTQGYGLSLNHGPYPFCTSRDVLAASLLSDVGLAPSDVGEVYGVLRTYPIRVAGNSGPMGMEISWADVARESGYASLEERTTVTKRVRRVGRIEWDLVQEAIRANGCTGLFVMFADYMDSRLGGLWTEPAHSFMRTQGPETRIGQFMAELIRHTSIPVLALSTGPESEHTIWLDKIMQGQLKEVANVMG